VRTLPLTALIGVTHERIARPLLMTMQALRDFYL
jgi:hypothetical protein